MQYVRQYNVHSKNTTEKLVSKEWFRINGLVIQGMFITGFCLFMFSFKLWIYQYCYIYSVLY